MILFCMKIPHLLELGINAVELLPVFEFDEFEFQRRPNPRDHMVRLSLYVPTLFEIRNCYQVQNVYLQLSLKFMLSFWFE